ncbi:uncharacterized protein LOC131630029 [Vicia villosa]|uniref:uncharacterized protein LOC131630029 n=1 Tax=Vicia villosa TaxID=3911 RepID=UPI00273B6546|nr:uncharacterized protein LOC131630029 [Vicia villosa]
MDDKLGDGHSILFWKSKWFGAEALYLQFPALFNEISFKHISVLEAGFWKDATWEWKLIKGEKVLGREASLEIRELLHCLGGIFPKVGIKDRHVWPYESSSCFSVKSCYILLNQNSVVVPSVGLMESLRCNWKAALPSKVQIFGWRLLRDRIPTRRQLLNRNIISLQQEVRCVFCEGQIEDSGHIFLQCPMLVSLKWRVFSCLEIQLPTVEDCCEFLLVWTEQLQGTMKNNIAAAIWLTFYWCIWKVRNEIIFTNAKLDIDELYYKIVWFDCGEIC